MLNLLRICAILWAFSFNLAHSKVISFDVTGKLSSVEYDFGGPASSVFVANVPIGSSYSFKYSYDQNSLPIFSVPSFFYSYSVPIHGNFLLGGTNFSLPDAGISFGSVFGQPEFRMSGNFGINPKLNNFFPIDFYMYLGNGCCDLSFGSSLPSTLNPSNFTTAYFRTRFASTQPGIGETGLLYSIDSIASSVSGVPEPQTWALMMVGFGIMGLMMRRKTWPQQNISSALND